MKGEILYKEYIREFDDNLNNKKIVEIIYRIISINDTLFFAEEISTGCIFPVYNYTNIEEIEEYTGGNIFKTYSYELVGKYYVFSDIDPTENTFKYTIGTNNEGLQPSIEEVNKYLRQKANNVIWERKIKAYEKQNHFSYDIETLKEAISQIKGNKNLKQFNLKEYMPQNKNYRYKPSINIKEISEFGYDLSSKEIPDNIIRREEYVKELIKTLTIKGKSLLIVGPPGSGKTSLIEDLALKIKHNSNKWLRGKLIFNLDIVSIEMNTKYRGDFEAKIQSIIDFCLKNKNNIILFIDEIHNLYGLGRVEDSSVDAINILKPYLSKNEIQTIGATTPEEYQKYLVNDPAFLERFEILNLDAIDEELNIKIILSYIRELEEKYNIKLNLDDIQKQELSRYIIKITDKQCQRKIDDTVKVSNPRLSKSIIEDAFAEALYNEKNKVQVEDICYAIISCHKLSPTFRKEKAQELKEMLNVKKIKNKTLQLSK